jgi:hypothetical protein
MSIYSNNAISLLKEKVAAFILAAKIATNTKTKNLPGNNSNEE